MKPAKHDQMTANRAAEVFYRLGDEGELIANGKRYRYFRNTAESGKRHKFRADEVGGNDYIGFNLYELEEGPRITTCELDWHDVIDFMSKIESNDP